MITCLSDINTQTPEGKLLLAAVSKITTESETNKTPHQILQDLNELSDKIYKHKS